MPFEYSFGTCANCKHEVNLTDYSRYWISAVLKKGTSMWFFPEKDKPLCGYQCALDYSEGHDKNHHSNLLQKTFVKLTE